MLLLMSYRLYLRITTLNIFLFEYVAFALLGLITFILIKEDTFPPHKWINDKYLKISFFIIFSLVLLIIENSLYIKPLSYYFLISIAWIVLGLQIINFNEHSQQKVKVIFIQILLLGGIIRFSSYAINHYIVGPDSYWHYNKITEILNIGHLDILAGWYYYYPTYHLMNLTSGALIGFSENLFSILSLISSTLILVFIYLIGCKIADERVGLMAALFATISTPLLFASMIPTHQSIGFLFLSIIIYILVEFNKPERRKNLSKVWIIFIFIALSIFFIHPATSITLILILVSNFLIEKVKKKGNFAPMSSYAMGFVSYIIFVNYSLFKTLVKSLFIPGETQTIPTVELQTTYFNNIEYLQYAFAYIGFTSFVLFGIYGILKWLKSPSNEKLFIIISLFFLHLLPLFSLVGESSSLDPGRMLLPVYLLLVFPAAYAWINIFKSSGNHVSKLIVFILSAFIIAFFSTSSYITWDDNEIFNDQIAISGGHLTQSAAYSHAYLSKIRSGSTLHIDGRSGVYLVSADRGPFTLPNINREDLGFDSFQDNGYFFINKPILEQNVWKSENDRKFSLKKADVTNNLYDNGNVEIFYNRE